MDRWKLIEGFTGDENWGGSEKVNIFLIMLMEKVMMAFRYRHDANAECIIHCGYEQSGHSACSQHYRGNATDFHINTKLPYFEQIPAMIGIITDLGASNHVGLGIYPDWNNPGFHLDVRGKIARWGFIGNEQVSLDAAARHARHKEVGDGSN
jgi:hypothetical protein